MNQEHTIAVIGLGYVGLPLAIEFGKKYRVVGFDVNSRRVAELERGEDHTLEADLVGMRQAVELYKTTQRRGLSFSCDANELLQANIFIVTVPTPIDRFNNPDLTPLLNASAMIGTGTLLVIIPLIVVYLFAQKGFVESLSQSGIKM